MTVDDAWMKQAACRYVDNPDKIFFPVVQKGEKPDYTVAKKVCFSCPVRAYCLAYAIAHKIPDGVWGGMSRYERRRIPAEIRVKLREAWMTKFATTRTKIYREEVR